MSKLYILLAFRPSGFHLKEVIRCTYKKRCHVNIHSESDVALSKGGAWNVRLETIGSPALGQGSNCKLSPKHQ